MKAVELKDKSITELQSMLENSRRDYFKLKMSHMTGQLEKVSDMANLRKDIARLKTVIRERELRG